MPGRRCLMFSASVFVMAVLPWEVAASVQLGSGEATRTRNPLDEETLYSALREGGWVRFHNWNILASRVQGRKLLQVTIKEFNEKGSCVATMRAKEAEFRIDQGKHILLLKVRDGNLVDKECKIGFTEKVFELPLPRGSKRSVGSLRDDPGVRRMRSLGSGVGFIF